VLLVDASVNLQLWKAIEEKRLIKLTYQGKPRILEPHDYGIQNGVATLLGYQLAGLSSHKLPGWRLMDESLVRDIELLDSRFAGGRPSSPGKHHKWDKLFIRVKPAEPKR
jgi:hypothetical protein